MKKYTGKTVEEILKKACEEQGVVLEELMYSVIEETKSLFSKKAVVEVYEVSDVIEFASNYLVNGIKSMGFEVTVVPTLKDDIIHLTINSDRSPILIGKNGKSLQALNELTRLAVANTFKKRFRILLDINGYKDEKYNRIVMMAKRIAHEVQKTRITATLDPMPADERRMVHNGLTNMPHIKTESIGVGKNRQVTITYID